MKVLIAAVSAADELSGVQRHAFNVVACLLRLREISSVHLALAPWQRRMAERHAPAATDRVHLHFVDARNTSLARNAWFYWRLPALANRLGADLVHAAYPVPLRRHAFHCPVVITLHDLYPYDVPQNFGPAKAWMNRLALRQSLAAADAIACVSDATMVALRYVVGARMSRKASRVYNCVDLPGQDSVASQKPSQLAGAVRFLLCIAQHRRNKNLDLALKCFHAVLHSEHVTPDLRLFVIGIAGPETAAIRKQVRQLGLTQRVILAEGLSDQELLWCYRHAAALLMPSVTEGFGLPAVEAIQAGCHVICSDIPVLREVGGPYCRFVPLTGNAVAAFADAVIDVLSLPSPSPVALPQFSAGQIAGEYLSLYSDLIAAERIACRPPKATADRSARETSAI